MRVRQEAQFALAAKASKIKEALPIVQLLKKVALTPGDPLPRFHAMWGLGQIFRKTLTSPAILFTNRQIAFQLESLLPLLADSDAEVRAHAVQLIGDNPGNVAEILKCLKDENPRVRFFALMALARSGSKSPVEPIVALLQTDDGRDPYIRHAAVMALTAIMAQPDQKAVMDHAADAVPAVRMAVLLAMRNRADVGITQFFDDSEPAIVLEAARAVAERSDTRMVAALPALAALASRSNLSETLWRRVLTAAEGLGAYPGNPRILASVAVRSDVPDAIRVEALNILGDWAKPPLRNRLSGLHRDMPERAAGPAVTALAPALDALVKSSPDRVRKAATNAAGKLGMESAGRLCEPWSSTPPSQAIRGSKRSRLWMR